MFLPDSIPQLFLKDLSKTVTTELGYRLLIDPIALRRFHRSFGLNPKKMHPDRLVNLSEYFPDTPVKVLKDVFEKLQLYDLAELLENVKKRTLRPVLPLEEMTETLVNNDRPAKVYSKAEVLIIDCTDNAAVYDNVKRVGSFFTDLQSQVTTLTTRAPEKMVDDLRELKKRKTTKENNISSVKGKERTLKELLKNQLPLSWYSKQEGSFDIEELVPNTDEQLMKVFYKELQDMTGLIQKTKEETEQWTKEKAQIEKDIQVREEEIQEEKENCQMRVSTIMDQWICYGNDEGCLKVESVTIDSYRITLSLQVKFKFINDSRHRL